MAGDGGGSVFDEKIVDEEDADGIEEDEHDDGDSNILAAIKIELLSIFLTKNCHSQPDSLFKSHIY